MTLVCQIAWFGIFFRNLYIFNCTYNLSIYMLLSLLFITTTTTGLNLKKICITFGGDKSPSCSYPHGD